MFTYKEFNKKTHRLIPSRYPTINFFDWAQSAEEFEQLALLEGLTNDRLSTECGRISLVAKEEWVSGPGSSPLMAAFTHFGPSRFSDGQAYGIYYTADSIQTAIAETKFHREIFLKASNEPPCSIHMREYTSFIKKPLIDLTLVKFNHLCLANVSCYPDAQALGREIQAKKEWGLLYPSARKIGALCMAIFRPKALSLPVQAGHYDYIWNGNCISDIQKLVSCEA